MPNPMEKELKSLRIQALTEGKNGTRVTTTMKLYDTNTQIESEEKELAGLQERTQSVSDRIARLKAQAAGYKQALDSFK